MTLALLAVQGLVGHCERVYGAQACGWYTVGEAGFSDGETFGNSLFVYEGIPYVAFQDIGDMGDACSVMAYRDGEWGYLGQRGFWGDSGCFASLVVSQDTPYVAYYGNDQVENLGNWPAGRGVTVWRCNMNAESWELLGDSFISEGDGFYPTLCIEQGTPYIAYQDNRDEVENDGKATVKRFNGAAASWAPVGPQEFSTGAARYTSMAMSNGVPYVAYADAARGWKATLVRYNGALRQWLSVGNPGFSAGETAYDCLSIRGGVPYVAYQDGGNGKKAVVMRYNANADRWEMVGGGPASAAEAVDVCLATSGGAVYVAYIDKASGELRVMTLVQGQWAQVGGGVGTAFADSRELPLMTLRCSSLFVYEGAPYVAYTDLTHNKRTTVKKYICPTVRVTRGANLVPDGGEYGFPDTSMNAWTQAQFTIHNDGTRNLTIDEITLDGADPMEFQLIPCANQVIPSGGQEVFTVRFAPVHAVPSSALVNIWSDAPNESPYTIGVTGTGIVAEINVRQGARNLPSRLSTYDFRFVRTGLTKDVVFTIENLGSAKLVLSRWLIGGDGISFRITVPPVSPVLPGRSTNMTIRFAPRIVGGKKGLLTISNSDPDEGQYVIGLTGIGN
jgi:hypothetical protein